MTDDFISRQAAIEALDGNVIVTSKESVQAVMDYIRGCADRIRSLPSAQPEIIRCKDCKYYYGRSCTAHDMPGDYLTPEDFCSWAQPKKRKE